MKSKYRIIKIQNSKDAGIYVQFRRRFLWIFHWWEYVISDDELLGGFYGQHKKFNTTREAEKCIEQLKKIDQGPQTKITNK